MLTAFVWVRGIGKRLDALQNDQSPGAGFLNGFLSPLFNVNKLMSWNRLNFLDPEFSVVIFQCCIFSSGENGNIWAKLSWDIPCSSFNNRISVRRDSVYQLMF